MNNYWDILNIEGEKVIRDIAIAFLNKEHCGVHEKENSSDIYFENPKKNYIESILIEKTNINQWNWSFVKKKNWNENWKPFFKKILIDKIKIIPSWIESDLVKDNDKIVIKINPGMAFGTGHHETTYMMIQAMLNFNLNTKTVFDIGTGSGVLSILAKKIGAKNIFAINNDQLTYNNFHENLELNNINNGIEFRIEDCFNIDNFNYDFIFANINLNILLNLIPRISNKGSVLILSGILSTDEAKISEVLNQKKIQNVYRKKEWLCLVIEL